MVPGAMGLVVGGGPLTQYARPTTMFVPSRPMTLARIRFYLRILVRELNVCLKTYVIPPGPTVLGYCIP